MRSTDLEPLGAGVGGQRPSGGGTFHGFSVGSSSAASSSVDAPFRGVRPLPNGLDGEPILRLPFAIQHFVLIARARADAQEDEIAHSPRFRLKKAFLIACRIEEKRKYIGRRRLCPQVIDIHN